MPEVLTREEKCQELLWSAVAAMLILVIAYLSPRAACAAESIPHQAQTYRGELVRNARMVWGLDAPVATFAAQVHQESAWNARAVSRVGAQGLAQFMPATANWIGGIDPALSGRQPENPVWALRALVTYDRWLWDRVHAVSGCDRMAMALAAYNGGLGWVIRDKAAASRAGADRERWWGEIERFNAGRSLAAWRENRGYPRRILQEIEPRYASWGLGSCA